jgi:hypothetical protein
MGSPKLTTFKPVCRQRLTQRYKTVKEICQRSKCTLRAECPKKQDFTGTATIFPTMNVRAIAIQRCDAALPAASAFGSVTL